MDIHEVKTLKAKAEESITMLLTMLERDTKLSIDDVILSHFKTGIDEASRISSVKLTMKV